MSASSPICLVTLGAEIPPGWQHPAEGEAGEGENRESPAPILSGGGVRLETLLASSANHAPISTLLGEHSPTVQMGKLRQEAVTPCGEEVPGSLWTGRRRWDITSPSDTPGLEMPRSRLSSAPWSQCPLLGLACGRRDLLALGAASLQ